jgi:excisionase family DNA binding protein
MKRSSEKELLSLSEAARRLGVHPSTLRRWADAGDIKVSVTPGGHRRFAVADLTGAAGVAGAAGAAGVSGAAGVAGAAGTSGVEVSNAPSGHHRDLAASSLSKARTAVHGHQARWTEITEKEKEEKRMLGRRMVGLLMQYLAASDGEGSEFLDEARAIGRIHAKSAAHEGLELSDTLRAALFFRDNIVESAVLLPASARDQPEAQARVYRRINQFMNAIQLEIAEVYDRLGQRAGRDVPD